MSMRVLWITVGAVILSLVIATIAANQWLRSYMSSREFLAVVSSATGSAFDAEANYEPITWTGPTAFSECATLLGGNGTLASAEARQLRATVNWRAIFSGAWRIEELEIASLDANFHIHSAGPQGKPAAAESPSQPPKQNALLSLLPKRFELGQAVVAKASLTAGPIAAQGMQLTISPDGRGWLFKAAGGTLDIPALPKLSITTIRAREQDGDLFLTNASLTVEGKGRISASGSSSDGGSLHADWDGIDASLLLQGVWKKHVSGLVEGNATLSPGLIEGDLTLRDGRLEDVPLLALIADFTGQPSFRRPPIQEASATFRHTDRILHVDNFSAESKGLFRVEGTFTIAAGGALSGTLHVGVTPQTLQWIPGSKEHVFKTARNGYVWTDVNIGGTLEHPSEDLSPRLAGAMGQQVIESGAGLLKNVPGAATGGAKSLLDILRPLVP